MSLTITVKIDPAKTSNDGLLQSASIVADRLEELDPGCLESVVIRELARRYSTALQHQREQYRSAARAFGIVAPMDRVPGEGASSK